MPPSQDIAARYPKLVDRTRRGLVTLILGAGVSREAGIPTWRDLVAAVRARARKFGLRLKPAPWLDPDPTAARVLEAARQLLAERTPDRAWQALDLRFPAPHPQAEAIALEEIEEALRRYYFNRTRVRDFHRSARLALENWLREALYARAGNAPLKGSLARIAKILREDRLRDRPRIVRVVTLNADDLLENALNAKARTLTEPMAWPIARASGHPRRQRTDRGRPAIPIYHIHGYLSRHGKSRARDAPETLVFTDLQYWECLASPGSFANRVMAAALHDSYCLFIGLSMTDINLMRWLGLRASEIQTDKLSEAARRQRHKKTLDGSIKNALRRHYWIRTADADPTGFITRHLARRGVTAIEIDDWGPSFVKLLEACFPAGDS